mmetsp:Transcript_171512/g.544808  ORF Transcript_171512/g.544808 Transcript_171512/m.544808 type:complete len:298 (-) Transcript_171512:220-1113(-)
MHLRQPHSSAHLGTDERQPKQRRQVRTHRDSSCCPSGRSAKEAGRSDSSQRQLCNAPTTEFQILTEVVEIQNIACRLKALTRPPLARRRGASRCPSGEQRIQAPPARRTPEVPSKRNTSVCESFESCRRATCAAVRPAELVCIGSAPSNKRYSTIWELPVFAARCRGYVEFMRFFFAPHAPPMKPCAFRKAATAAFRALSCSRRRASALRAASCAAARRAASSCSSARRVSSLRRSCSSRSTRARASRASRSRWACRWRWASSSSCSRFNCASSSWWARSSAASSSCRLRSCAINCC